MATVVGGSSSLCAEVVSFDPGRLEAEADFKAACLSHHHHHQEASSPPIRLLTPRDKSFPCPGLDFPICNAGALESPHPSQASFVASEGEVARGPFSKPLLKLCPRNRKNKNPVEAAPSPPPHPHQGPKDSCSALLYLGRMRWDGERGWGWGRLGEPERQRISQRGKRTRSHCSEGKVEARREERFPSYTRVPGSRDEKAPRCASLSGSRFPLWGAGSPCSPWAAPPPARAGAGVSRGRGARCGVPLLSS